MIEGDQPAEDGLLPDRQTDAVAELQCERRLLVGEAELLCARPDGSDLTGGRPRSDQVDGRVQVIAAALVGVDERPGGAGDGECAVVTGPVAHIAVQDVEVRGVARAQRAIGEYVRVRAAALPRDGIHALHELRAHLVEHLVDQRNAVVLTEARTHGAVELLVGGVDHRARHVQQGDLVARLDHPCLLHQLLAIRDLKSLALEREQHLGLDGVDPYRLAE